MKKYSDSASALIDYLQFLNQILDLPDLNEERTAALMYLVLREGYAVFGKPLFEAGFSVDWQGLYYHPVQEENTQPLSTSGRLIAASVLEQYGKMDSSSFRDLFEKENCLRTGPYEKPVRIGEEEIRQESRKLSVLNSLWSMNVQAFHPAPRNEKTPVLA